MAQQFNFKRLEEPFEADWPVTVNVPEDGGKTATEEFMARFRIVREFGPTATSTPSADAEDVATAEAAPEDPLEKARQALKESALKEWRRWFVGFGKPTSDQNELTDEVLWNIITTPYARVAVQAAYQNFCSGIAVKN